MSELMEGVAADQIQEAYKRIKSGMMAELTAQMDLKEAEQKLKDDIVQENQFYKKDNVTPDYAKVKMALLKKAIAVVELEAKNTLDEQMNIYDGYLSDLRSDRISKAAVNGYVRKTKMVSEAKEGFKDTKENLKSEINGDIVEALVLLAKNEVEGEKERLEAEGGKPPREKKDKSQLSQLLDEIRSMLGK
jgi:hypothetical protein